MQEILLSNDLIVDLGLGCEMAAVAVDGSEHVLDGSQLVRGDFEEINDGKVVRATSVDGIELVLIGEDEYLDAARACGYDPRLETA